MGADDDAGCVEHVWELTEVHLGMAGADLASCCARCGAVRYEPSQSAGDPDRPPL